MADPAQASAEFLDEVQRHLASPDPFIYGEDGLLDRQSGDVEIAGKGPQRPKTPVVAGPGQLGVGAATFGGSNSVRKHEEGVAKRAEEEALREVNALLDEQYGEKSKAELAADWLGQETIEGETLPALDRLRIAWLNNTEEERLARFHQLYPDGDLQTTPFGIEVYKRSSGDQYRNVERPFLESLMNAEMLVDAGEFLAGPSLPLAGEVAGAVVAQKFPVAKLLNVQTFPKGTRLLNVLGRTVTRPEVAASLGAIGGATVDQLLQTATGSQRQTLLDQLKDVGTEGVFSLGGNYAGTGILRGYTGVRNIIQGRGAFPAKLGTEAAQEAAERQAVPLLLASQTSDVGLIQMIGRQAERMLHRIRHYHSQQDFAQVKALRALGDPVARANFQTNSLRALALAKKRVLNFTRSSVRHEATTNLDAGRAMQEGVQKYSEGSAKQVNQLYRLRDSIEEPSYNLARGSEVFDDLLTAKFALGRKEMRPLLNDSGTPVIGPDGNPIMQEFRDNIRVGSELNPQVKDVLNRIRRIDPEIPPQPLGNGNALSSTDQIMALRQELYELTVPKAGEIRKNPEWQALKAYNALTDIIENPRNANPEFLTAHKAATRAAAERFETFEQLIVQDFLRAHQKNPAKLVSGLWAKDGIGDLANLRAAMTDEYFENVRYAFKNHLLDKMEDDGPDKVMAQLNAMDRSTRSALITETEYNTFRDAAAKIRDYNRSAVGNAIENQEQLSVFIDDVITGSEQKTFNFAVLRDLSEPTTLQQVAGVTRKETEFGLSLRSAILGKIFDDSIEETARGVVRLNSEAFEKAAKQLLDVEGLSQFMTASDLKTIADVRLIQDFLGQRTSTGVGIEVSKVAGYFPLNMPALTAQVGSANLIERFILSKQGQKLLSGSSDPAHRFSVAAQYRILGGFFATMKRERADQAPIKDDLDTARSLSGVTP